MISRSRSTENFSERVYLLAVLLAVAGIEGGILYLGWKFLKLAIQVFERG
jgi:hypothetical protein